MENLDVVEVVNEVAKECVLKKALPYMLPVGALIGIGLLIYRRFRKNKKLQEVTEESSEE